MDSLCLVVPKKKAEPVRKRLIEKGMLRKGLQIKSDAKSVYIPVIQRVDIGYPMTTADFKEIQDDVKDYRVLVEIPDDLRELLPSSFDTLGTIAIVKMADEVVPYAKSIGGAIIATQKSIQTVCLDSGVADRFRTRGVKVVAGEKTTVTTHKEYGLVFRMDVAKVFFSPRLATERENVAKQVAQGEVVIDMFAGIGPFSIMIARTRAPRVVYAIDMNPDAVEYMKENLALNKVSVVVPILGDARDKVKELEKADRIIMNLPHNASEFIKDAISALKVPGMIHYYEIMEDQAVQARLDSIKDVALSMGLSVSVEAKRRVKSYSPTMNFYGFDLRFF